MVGWPKKRLLSPGGGSCICRTLFALKAQTQATSARIPPEPEASLLTGILLSVEAGVPEGVMDAFPDTGTTQVIAISGFDKTRTT